MKESSKHSVVAIMFMSKRENFGNDVLADFGKPVESIMACENFKSNFARRLSNRYIGKSPSVGIKQNTSFRLQTLRNEEPLLNGENRATNQEVKPFINTKEKVNIVKKPEKSTKSEMIASTEIAALNLEVETLKWQLAQTESNRQMHLALLKQIVSFLNRVKEHMECQKQERPSMRKSSVKSERSINSFELPRSMSVLNFNKNMDLSMSQGKKTNYKKISKSIGSVNGIKDLNAAWIQSKLSLIDENESGKKITEEITRLITLANTVISTKIPDLACSCDEKYETISPLTEDKECAKIISHASPNKIKIRGGLDLIEEDCTKAINSSTYSDNSVIFDDETSFDKNDKMSEFSFTPSPLSSVLNEEIILTLPDEEDTKINGFTSDKDIKLAVEKPKDLNIHGNYIEDESGFSSMSSFQDIGIPIINITPATPCKEEFPSNELDIISIEGNWKTSSFEYDKQSVKVFWV